MKPHLLILVVVALALVSFFGYLTLKPIFNTPTPKENLALTNLVETKKQENPQITFINPYRGTKDAKLTIVEYGDYLCGFCASVEETLNKLLIEYKDKIKIVWKDFPLINIHPLSDDLAEGARCAHEDGKFWEYHSTMLKEQNDILSEADIFRVAKDLGLGQKFDNCYKNHDMRARVEADFEEGVSLGVTGAPYFFIGKERLSGAVSYERFKNTIDAQINN